MTEPSLFDMPDLAARIEADIQANGTVAADPDADGAVGVTMFDLPGSEDNTITVLLPKDAAQSAPSQSLVRIKSRSGTDGRRYLGVVTAGPFAEPDSLRADSHLLVTVATRGGSYQPPYHGRVQVTILGEELEDGSLVPPRLRPLPNSPVFALSEAESAKILKADGDIRIGLVSGYENVPLCVPSREKSVLPRHTAVLGTTGGGKSNTVARLVQQAQAAGMAVVLFDVEGEYTHLHKPTSVAKMKSALAARGLEASGLPPGAMTVYHLVGRESANPDHPQVRPFSLQFARLSPYAACEILGLNDVQQTRFLRAYDIAKEVLRDLDIFPKKGDPLQERFAMELDEFERGYPRLTLSLFIDIVSACEAVANTPKGGARGRESGETEIAFEPFNEALKTPAGWAALTKRIHAGPRPDHAASWRAVLSRLWRLKRLQVFDDMKVGVMNFKELLKPGRVSIIDLSDSGMSELNNIVIADMLTGLQSEQDTNYEAYEAAKRAGTAGETPPRTLIVIEEAHEFLSDERIDKMSNLFEQVAKIAKRGRKRWLGLAFVTQLPQHLPRQIFGLVNSYILHKITDPQVTAALRKTVSGIDESLWNRLAALAPGQAIASFPHLARPLLVSVDASPAELRMVD
jgi:DNA helicase HerA-like ATPase